MRYRCRLCGREFQSLSEWYRHIVRDHPEDEPGWAYIYRLEGRRVSMWKVYLDLKAEGKVEVMR
jgi:hypothetical protein